MRFLHYFVKCSHCCPSRSGLTHGRSNSTITGNNTKGLMPSRRSPRHHRRLRAKQTAQTVYDLDSEIYDAQPQIVSESKSSGGFVNRSVTEDADFFGIQEYEMDSMNTYPSKTVNYSEVIKQLDLKQKVTRDYEKVFDASYGMIRFDSDNSHKTRKRNTSLESERLTRKERERNEGNSSTATEEYGGKEAHTEQFTSHNTLDFVGSQHTPYHEELNNSQHHDELNYFDQQLFTNTRETSHCFNEPSLGMKQDSNIYNEHNSNSNVNNIANSFSTRYSTTEVEHEGNNFIEEQYFGENQHSVSTQPDFVRQQPMQSMGSRQQSGHHTREDNLAEPYNEPSMREDVSNQELRKENSIDKTGSDFIDDQYFMYNSSAHTPYHETVQNTPYHTVHGSLQESRNAQEDENTQGKRRKLSTRERQGHRQGHTIKENPFDSSKNEYHEPDTKLEKRQAEKIKFDLKNPTTAYEMVLKLRQQQMGKDGERKVVKDDTKEPQVKYPGLVDSHGFRILKDQVLDFSRVTEDVVVNILKESILYNHDGVLAINKPYGLPCHGGPGVHNSIARALPKLARLLEKDENTLPYTLVHRLDQDTTGVMLIAKNAEMSWKLRGMFRRREVLKIYWAITKDVPQPPEGVVNIPITEGHCNHIYRMVLQPENTEETREYVKKSSRQVFEAITNFKVLDFKGSAALVELQPETGVKHQLRCHLAFGLNTPVLGDHKYSHIGKIAPQRLHPDLLFRLGIRQSKVRHVPMHLHAKTVVLPEFRDGRNVFISANLPRHFKVNMKRLKLKAP